MNFRKERTFVMIKPDGVKRGLVGEAISRFERVGLKIVALDMFKPTFEQVDEHYPKDEAWLRRVGERSTNTYQKYGMNVKDELGTDDTLEIGNIVRKWLSDYLNMAPMVRMVIEGPHAVDMVRKMVGDTIPASAQMGTIRGDFCFDSPILANNEKRGIYNMIHASETPEEVAHEIEHWFGSSEDIFDYERTNDMV